MWTYHVIDKGFHSKTYKRYATAEEALRAGLRAADQLGITPEAVVVSRGRTLTDLAFAQVGR